MGNIAESQFAESKYKRLFRYHLDVFFINTHLQKITQVLFQLQNPLQKFRISYYFCPSNFETDN